MFKQNLTQVLPDQCSSLSNIGYYTRTPNRDFLCNILPRSVRLIFKILACLFVMKLIHLWYEQTYYTFESSLFRFLFIHVSFFFRLVFVQQKNKLNLKTILLIYTQIFFYCDRGIFNPFHRLLDLFLLYPFDFSRVVYVFSPLCVTTFFGLLLSIIK